MSKEDFARIKAEKRQKNQQKKQKITENRKSLGNVRVVQKNLVFVLGLPARLADTEVSSSIISYLKSIEQINYVISFVGFEKT